MFSSKSSNSSNSSHFISMEVAKAMVWSNIGLSCLDYPLNRKNRNIVCTLLTDLDCKIIAVWVCARPVDRDNARSFEHWCVKIQAPPVLLSIDFLESENKGAFGLQQTSANNAELEDFLCYYLYDDNGRHKKKWKILASVTPHPLKNLAYKDWLDKNEYIALKKYMENSQSTPANKILADIDCDKKVSDLSDFLAMWTSDVPSLTPNQNSKKYMNATANGSAKNSNNNSHSHSNGNGNSSNSNSKHQKSNSNSVTRTYNPITSNCQQFAVDLFEFLVGHGYNDKVVKVQRKVQSPFDIKYYDMKHKTKANMKNISLLTNNNKKKHRQNGNHSQNGNGNGNGNGNRKRNSNSNSGSQSQKRQQQQQQQRQKKQQRRRDVEEEEFLQTKYQQKSKRQCNGNMNGAANEDGNRLYSSQSNNNVAKGRSKPRISAK